MMGTSQYSFMLCALLMTVFGVLAQEAGPSAADSEALLELKASFNSSILNNSWIGINVCFLNDSSGWYGIQCHNNRVIGITLESLGLTGQINANALLGLTELSILSFKNNSLSGYLMDFTGNHKLGIIDLSSNDFDGPISPSLVTLNSLEVLRLQENRLTGSIPRFNQLSWTEFNVSNNLLSGPIPNTGVLQSLDSSSYTNNKDLCGPPSPTACSSTGATPVKYLNDTASPETDKPAGKSSNQKRFGTLLVIVNVIGLIVLLALLIVYYKKLKRLRGDPKRTNSIVEDEKSHEAGDEEKGSEDRKQKRAAEGDSQEHGKLAFMEGVVGFELGDLLKASAESLGKGNFGNTYKATLDDGRHMVVKRLRDLKPLSSDEFVKQLAAIADLQHPNLLPLLAFYYSKDEKLLVHKFIPRGNLFDRLHGGRGTKDRIPFRWSGRLSVARGVARALEYLHLNPISQAVVPHGNLKLSNVLLDEDDVAIVCDYGFTSIIANPIAYRRLLAYKSPEYLSSKKVSKKSDVWSYGNLLLELLTGRISTHSAPQDGKAVDLCSWVHRAVREEWTAEIFDLEMMVHRSGSNGMLRLLQIAVRCCDKSPEKRPKMSEVVREVENIKVINVDSESEEDLSMDQSLSLSVSLTDESISAMTAPSIIMEDHER